MPSLHPFEIRHSDMLRRLRADREVMNMLLAGPPSTEPGVYEAWLAKRMEEPLFKVVEVSDEPAGYIQIADVHRRNGYGSAGLALDAQFRGRGYGRWMMTAVESEAIRLGIRKLLLQVHVNNHVASRLYRNMHYRAVGVFQRHYWDGADYVDVRLYEKELLKYAHS